MGSSASEIDKQINETRDHLDANLDVLEHRAVSRMKWMGGRAAIGVVAGLVVAGVAFLVIRRMRKPSLGDRIHDVLPSAFTDLPEELKKKFGNRPFKVIITSADADEKGGVWESTARKVAPAVVTSAVTALMAQVARKDKDKSASE